MKTPEFWGKSPPTLGARLLSPLSTFYQWAYHRRVEKAIVHRSPVPVLCVGNVTAGGSGKTPICIELAIQLQAQGKKVVFLSRGYGGALKGPVQVSPVTHGYKQVGDEPLLLAQVAPTVIAKQRHQGLTLAAYLGGDVIIMDDGLQNPFIYKDISLLVMDGTTGLGNGMTLPSGPLREPLRDVLRRVQGVIIMGDDAHNLKHQIAEIDWQIPVFYGGVNATCQSLEKGQRVVAFAGIGYPNKFFTTVTQLGYDCVYRVPYGDHYPYKKSDIKILQDLATTHNAQLVTTAKDKTRLPPDFQNQVHVIDITAHWQDQHSPLTLLRGVL